MKRKTKTELIEEIRQLQKENEHLMLVNEGGDTGSSNFKIVVEDIFEKVFNNAGLGIALLNEEGYVVKVNNILSKIFGYSRKEILNGHFKDIIHPDDIEPGLSLFYKLVQGKINSYQVEKRYIRKDGGIVWCNITTSIIIDKKNRTKNIIGVVEDISKKKETEKKLQEEQYLFKQLMDYSHDLIFFRDRLGSYKRVNKAVSEKHGNISLTGKNPLDFFSEQSSKEIFDSEKDLISKGKPIINREEKIVYPDGKINWVSTTKVPTYDENGNINGSLGIVRDNTAKRLAESDLNKLASVSPGMMGSFYLKPNGTVCMPYVSPRIWDYFGLYPEDVKEDASKLLERTHPDDMQLVNDSIMESARTMKLWNIEYRVIHPTYGILWLESNTIPEPHPEGGVIWYGFVHDITARKLTENAFRQSEQKYKILVNSVEGIVWEAEVETFRFTFVSKYAEQLLGYPVNQWLNDPNFWIEHIHPDDKERSVETCLNSTKAAKNHDMEYRMIAADKRIVWLKDIVSVIVEGDNITKLRGLMIDITELKLAEEKLKAAERRLSRFFESAPGFFYIGRDTKDSGNFRFTFVSRGILEIYGLQPADALKDISKVRALEYPEDIEVIRNSSAVSAKNLLPFHVEYRINHPEKGTIWVESRALPEDNGNGDILWYGFIHDITERKKNAIQLMESEAELRALFDSMADVVLVFNKEGRYLKIPSTNAQLLYRPAKELLGRRLHEVLPKKQADFLLKYILEVIEKKQSMQIEYSLIIDGEEKWFSATAAPMKEDTVMVVARDITEIARARKVEHCVYRISEAGHNSTDMNTLYKTIHKTIDELITAKNFYIALYNDETGMISFPYYVDEYDATPEPRFLRRGLTEYTLRKKESQLITPGKRDQLKKQGEIEDIGAQMAVWLGAPLKIIDKTIGVVAVQDYDNTERYGEPEKKLLVYAAEQIALAIERRNNIEIINRQIEELKQSNITKDKFFSIIAHDLRNPFVSLLGFTEMLIKDYNDFSHEERMHYINEMKKSAESTYNLLQDLLQWSRSQTGVMEYSPAKLNLKSLVEENIYLVKNLAAQKQIKLDAEFKGKLHVYADENMIAAVIRNLLTNAIKFTHKNGKVKIEGKKIGNRIEISVYDNGMGMDENTKTALFRVGRIHSMRGTNNEAGTGLGLILCKEFIDKNEGTIYVESKPGKGSKFTFVLNAYGKPAE